MGENKKCRYNSLYAQGINRINLTIYIILYNYTNITTNNILYFIFINYRIESWNSLNSIINYCDNIYLAIDNKVSQQAYS